MGCTNLSWRRKKEKYKNWYGIYIKTSWYYSKKGKLSRIPFRGQTPPGVLFAVYDSISKQAECIPPEWIDIEHLLMNWLTGIIIIKIYQYQFYLQSCIMH